MQQITAKQIGEFIKLAAGNVSRAQFQRRLEDTQNLLDFFKTGEVKIGKEQDHSALITDWQKFYKQVFGKEFVFSNLSIPAAPPEYSWLVCVHPELSIEEILSGGKNPQPHWKWTDKPLDNVIDDSFGRDSLKQPYIVRFRPNIEADEDLKNMSADMVQEQKLNAITLKERLLLGCFLYWKEGIILDKKTITLCSGSRFSVGGIPGVYWLGGKVDGLGYSSSYRHGSLRPRQAVSF